MSVTEQHWKQPWEVGEAATWLPIPQASDDKYLRGVLGVRTGFAAFPGAAVLNTMAAWRAGVGMLRYVPPLVDTSPQYGLPTPAAAVLATHPETVFGSGSADTWLLGSGTDPADRSDEERDALAELLRGDAPVVVDAGALELAVALAVDADGDAPPPPRVFTPHRGEFLRLWKASGLGARPAGWPVRSRSGRSRQPRTTVLTEAASQLAAQTGATVLLKGSLTVAATPGGSTTVVGPATPWLATAGTGDVLAGILGALVTGHADAVREDPELLGPLAATAAALHDAAARIASGDAPRNDDDAETAAREVVPAGAPITAGDVAEAIPAAISAIRTT